MRTAGDAGLPELLVGSLPAAVPGVGGAVRRARQQIADPDFQVGTLIRLAEVVAKSGDLDGATRLCCRARVRHRGPLRLAGEAVDRAAQTTDMPFRVEGLAALADAVAVIGELRPSGALVAQVMARHSTRGVLAKLVAVVAACGDHERAEAFAARITDPYRQADAVACLAATFLDANAHTPEITCQLVRGVCSARHSRPVHGSTSSPNWPASTRRPSVLSPPG